jgi:hypothetical protein
MDLTKDFYFSYSYNVMQSLQKNMCSRETGQSLYETMFVWNEFLTRGIRNHLRSTLWTVALVYGFFKQVELSLLGRDFKLTLIARRSRHYAGTRYLKRGVNEKGRVANDVETEQIVYEDVPEGCTMQISSVVQNRGSIPLFWSQETSRLNIKPDIILSKKDHKYGATRLHFENLVKRYGNPVIILNLIKTREKKPRESILRTEFANAIAIINKDLPKENRLRFLHWDLNKYSRNKKTNVLALLGKVAAYALDLTGIFYCQLTSDLGSRERPYLEDNINGGEEYIGSEEKIVAPQYQRGVLRTNCIDCLDRTNVAQYAYGLVALGHQLHALGLIELPNIDLDSALADNLMKLYETMGDTLALQYGGSAAHNKIFSERRGQWKAATQSHEFLRTLQRYYSNAYMDAEKQDAINVFLGHFQPQQGKPALWELDSDQHYSVGTRGSNYAGETPRSFIKRSLSDGNLMCESNPTSDVISERSEEESIHPLADKMRNGGSKGLSDSSPEISTCESDTSCMRYTPTMSRRELFPDLHPAQCRDGEHMCFHERSNSFNCSNFLDVDLISSSGNSCEEESYERSALINSVAGISLETLEKGGFGSASGGSIKGKEYSSSYGSARNSDLLGQYSDSFVNWVTHGHMLFP